MSRYINLGKEGKKNLKNYIDEKALTIDILARKMNELFDEKFKTAQRRIYRWISPNKNKQGKDFKVREDLLRKTLRVMECPRIIDYKYLPEQERKYLSQIQDDYLEGNWYSYCISRYGEKGYLIGRLLEIFSGSRTKSNQELNCRRSQHIVCTFSIEKEDLTPVSKQKKLKGWMAASSDFSDFYEGRVSRFLEHICFELVRNDSIGERVFILAQDPKFYRSIPLLTGISTAVNIDHLPMARIWFALKDQKPTPQEALDFIKDLEKEEFFYDQALGILQRKKKKTSQYLRENINDYFGCLRE